MVKIITVHGTNAGADSDYGDQWWQLDSDFQKSLSNRIVEPLEFEAYHWSGANSERERRDAGSKLAKKILNEKQPPIVVGHSHGGSVALHSLLLMYLKKPQIAVDAFRSLITVGTPMIRYKAAANPMFRFNIVGQLFLIYAVLISMLVGAAFILGDAVEDLSDLVGESLLSRFLDLKGGFWGLTGQLVTPAVLFASVLPLVVLTLFTRRTTKRNRLFANNTLLQAIGGIYAPLNHAMDEAITALRGGVGLKLKIVSRATVRSAIFTPLALLLAGFLVAKTVSETINIEALTADTVVEEESMTDAPVMTMRGEEPLALRDPVQRLRYLSGDLRRNADASGRIRSGLTRQMVYLKNDYVVLDLGTLLRNASSKDEFILGLRTLSPTARAQLVSLNNGTCLHYALYITPSARDNLVTWAQSLPARTFANRPDGLTVGESAALTQALRRGSPTKAPNCPATAALDMPGAAAAAALLQDNVILNIAAGSLVSARGPAEILIQNRQSGLKRRAIAASLRYPALETGQALVFERSAYNDVQLTCMLSYFGTRVSGFTPWEREKSTREQSIRALCDQVEGGNFTFYDLTTTIVGEVQFSLENTVTTAVTVLDQFFRYGGLGFPSAETYLDDNSIQTGILSPFYFVFSVLIVAWIFAALLSFILAPFLSGIFNNVIRQGIFGNDGYGENVQEVAPGLDFEATQISTLPEKVEKDLFDYVQKFAPQTIARVREIISLSAMKNANALPVQEISEALTWKELIHTAYFDVDSFVDHFADMLVEKGGLTRR